MNIDIYTILKGTKILTVLAAAALCLCTASSEAAPAKRRMITFTQPDGSTFRGYVIGDEFCHIRTNAEGGVIAKDADGWWKPVSSPTDGGIFPKTSEKRRIFNEITSRKPMTAGLLSQNAAEGTAQKKNGIVILAQFKDVPFTYTRQNFVDMLTLEGYSFNGADGSAKDYFNLQFDGLIDFSFDVSEIVTLPKDRKYYGGNNDDGNDKNPEQMVIDACRLAADCGTDFSEYDDDNDGYVDNVFIFFSGEDEADTENEDCIWSHAYYIESGSGKTLTLNGKKIDRYACTAELSPEITEDGYLGDGFVLAGIGTFCHEYSHTFGLPDLYDTDYAGSGGQAEALWYVTGLMDGGNSNNGGNTPPNYNAIDMECLGLGEALPLTDGEHTLKPIHEGRTYYRMETDRKGEYYLFECRDNSSLWDRYIFGAGLLVYHIDKSKNAAGKSDNYGETLTAADRWDIYNEVNCRPDRQCANLVEADPSVVKKAYHRYSQFNPTGTQIKSIFFPSGKHDMLDASNGLKYWSGGECPVTISGIVRNADGSVTFTVTGAGSADDTATADRDNPPVMDFSAAQRNDDGSFRKGKSVPLSLLNAEGALYVEWFFNEKVIDADADFKPSASGTLKAVLTYRDGTEVTVSKRIVTR